mgnify:FL=1
MTKREFTAVYKNRCNTYIGWVEEIPGVNTQGKTKREIKENLNEAILLILEANKKLASKEHQHVYREPLFIGIPA